MYYILSTCENQNNQLFFPSHKHNIPSYLEQKKKKKKKERPRKQTDTLHKLKVMAHNGLFPK